MKQTQTRPEEIETGAGAQRRIARTAGVLYLIIFVAGIFAQFIVRQALIVPGDAGATAGNIIASEGLFRAGIAADLVMIVADIAIGLLFYVLLRHVSQALALLAAFFRLAQAATLGVNLLNLMLVLELLGGSAYLGAFETEQLQALVLPFLNAHATGYAFGLIFFGFSILFLAILLIKSSAFPSLLGVMLFVPAAGYVVDGFARVLLTNYADYQPIFDNAVFVPAFIAELALCLWLLIKGVRTPKVTAEVALNPA